MHKKSHNSKVMGPRGARIVRSLNEAGYSTFSVADALLLSGVGEKATRDALRRLLLAGVISRVKPGLYNLVPFELGDARDYLGSAPKVAVEIARRALAEGTSFFLSHGTAMAIHQMTTQPQLTVFLTASKQLRPVTTMGTEIRFISVGRERVFGIADHWIDKTTALPVSDLERTILDGLRQPDYCGGLVEVAKGLWIVRRKLDLKRLAAYTKRLGIGAVAARLAYLLDLYQIADQQVLAELRLEFPSNFALLDPNTLAEGRRSSKWRLRMNVGEEELKAATRT